MAATHDKPSSEMSDAELRVAIALLRHEVTERTTRLTLLQNTLRARHATGSDVTTNRIYEQAQRHFLAWTAQERIDGTPGIDAVARYLTEVAATRGDSVAPVHLSALASLYRDHGGQLDSKCEAIQAVIAGCRARMRERKKAARFAEIG